METQNQKPVTAVIVGGGHRSIIYGDYSLKHPEALKIVGIADPDRFRCLSAAKRYGFGEDCCFSSAEELASRPRMADAIINGTMDHQHFLTAAPLLKLGYDMLLEKPFAVSEEEMTELMSIIKEHGNRVMVCHVLRYTPFYLECKKIISSGKIGDVINIQLSETVSYHHISTAYVRGKWANSDICRTSMLLAKSCHDVDIMMWLMGGDKPVSVSSNGSKFQFIPENAPEGSAMRCMPGCIHADTCPFSAKRIYLNHPNRWSDYVWAEIEEIENPTVEDKKASLEGDNRYGRCIYKCDNNVVDHQSLLVTFASGATGTHNMTGGSARSARYIHVIGTRGEIEGVFEDNLLTLRLIDADAESGYSEETTDFSKFDLEGHGGGDDNLTADFVEYVRTGRQSLSCTAIENSVAGHLTVFRADKSRENGGALFKLL